MMKVRFLDDTGNKFIRYQTISPIRQDGSISFTLVVLRYETDKMA